MTHITSPQSGQQLLRVKDGAMIAGVCGGIARWLGWDVTIVRLLYVVISVASVGFPGLIVYLLLWAIMPLDRQS